MTVENLENSVKLFSIFAGHYILNLIFYKKKFSLIKFYFKMSFGAWCNISNVTYYMTKI